MALLQRLRTAYGTDNNFWRVQRLLYDVDAQTITILYAGWLDEAAFLAGSQPQTTQTLTLEPPDSDPFTRIIGGVSIETLCERAIQATPTFTGATIA